MGQPGQVVGGNDRLTGYAQQCGRDSGGSPRNISVVCKLPSHEDGEELMSCELLYQFCSMQQQATCQCGIPG